MDPAVRPSHCTDGERLCTQSQMVLFGYGMRCDGNPDILYLRNITMSHQRNFNTVGCIEFLYYFLTNMLKCVCFNIVYMIASLLFLTLDVHLNAYVALSEHHYCTLKCVTKASH